MGRLKSAPRQHTSGGARRPAPVMHAGPPNTGYWKPQAPPQAPPRKRGLWYEDRPTQKPVGSFKTPCYPDLRPWDCLIVPSEKAISSWVPRGISARECFDLVLEADDETSPATDVDIFSTLPAEIHDQVIRLLIPNGCVFHIFPTLRNGNSATAIQMVSRVENEAASNRPVVLQPHRMALARTSRRFHDTVNMVLYGENQFVLDIAMDQVTAYVIVDEGAAGQTQSWTRSFDVPFIHAWPITAHTARYVTNLTLAVCLPEDNSDFHSRCCLQGHLDRIVHLLEPEARLKNLAVDLGVSFWSHTVIDRLHLRQDDKGSLYLEAPIDHSASSISMYGELIDLGPQQEVLLEILRPLKRLRGVKDVRVTGLVDNAYADEMSAVMRSASIDVEGCDGVAGV